MQHLATWIPVGSVFNLVAVWIMAFEFFCVTCLVFVLAALRILALDLPVDSPEFQLVTLQILAFELLVNAPEFLACDAPDTGI